MAVVKNYDLIDSAIGRVSSVSDSTGTLGAFSYLGMDTVLGQEVTERDTTLYLLLSFRQPFWRPRGRRVLCRSWRAATF